MGGAGIAGGGLLSLATSLAAAVLLADTIVSPLTTRQLCTSPAAAVLLVSQACGFVVSRLHKGHADMLRPYLEPLSHLNLDHMRGGAILAPWLTIMAAGVWAGVRIRSGFYPRLGYPRLLMLLLAMVILIWASSRWESPSLTPHAALLLWVVSVAHFVGCAVDCWLRARSKWTFSLHLYRLSVALAYVAPASLPIVLGSSSLLLAFTSLFKLTPIDPESLRWLVRWGAVHAPFWFVHLETRRTCFAQELHSGGSRHLYLGGAYSRGAGLSVGLARVEGQREHDSLLPYLDMSSRRRAAAT
jgi:hypothetical protein